MTIRRAGYPDIVRIAGNINGGDAEDGWIKVRSIDLSAYPPGSFDVEVWSVPSGTHTFSNAFTLLPDTGDWLESVGAWGGAINQVHAEPGRIILGSGRRLVILDSTDESNLIELGAIDLKTTVLDFEVRGNFVFVCTSLSLVNQFCVVDISNPAAPQLVWTSRSLGIARLQDWPLEVELYGDTAYVLTTSGRLHRFDISNPAAPAYLGQVLSAGIASRFEIDDQGRMFSVRWASGSILKIHDVAANPADPPLLSSTALAPDAFGSNAYSIKVHNNIAVVTHRHGGGVDRFYGFDVIDVTDPSAPAVLSSTPTNYAAAGEFALLPGLVLIAEEEHEPESPVDPFRGLLVYSIADPTSPVLISNVKTHGSVYGVVTTARADRAYVLDAGEGLVVVELLDPAHPVRLGSYLSPASPQAMVADGNLLYVSDTWNGFTILDVADPARPRVVGVYQTEGTNQQDHLGIAYRNGLVYLAAGYGGIDIVDVSDPANPVRVDNFSHVPSGAISVRTCGLELVGTTLRVGAVITYPLRVEYQLWNLQLLFPTAPVFSGSVSTVTTPALKIQSEANVTHSTGVFTIDNTNSAAPTVLWSQAARDFARIGNTLYTCTPKGSANAYSCIRRWDLANPTAPNLIGEFYLATDSGLTGNYRAITTDAHDRIYVIGQMSVLINGNATNSLHLFEPTGDPSLLRLEASLAPEPVGPYTGPALPVPDRDHIALLATSTRIYVADAERLRTVTSGGSGNFQNHGVVIVERRTRCRTDSNADGAVNSADVSAFLAAWVASLTGGTPEADFDFDGIVNSADISAFLAQWLADLNAGNCM